MYKPIRHWVHSLEYDEICGDPEHGDPKCDACDHDYPGAREGCDGKHCWKNDERVKAATVKVIKRGGQGVLVHGGLILTAAHCVEFSCEGGMVLGDYYIEDIETGGGILQVAPLAVEPVKDIAVLGNLDEQEFYKEVVAYEAWYESIEPVPLCFRKYKRFQEFDTYIFTHEGTWVHGKSVFHGEDGSIFSFDSKEPIKGGTSGGPIVNAYGELLGVVSNASETTTRILQGGPEVYNGFHPRASSALPVWVIQKIKEGMRGGPTDE